MVPSSPYSAPWSPVLLAGFLLRPVPGPLLRPFADAAMIVMRRRHRDLFARLSPLAGNTFLIEPADLPLRFALHFAPHAVTLTLLTYGRPAPPATVTIRAPFIVLIDLLEGRSDADAAFFARDVAIEGDTEAALFLRNVLEADDIDVMNDLIEGVGPLAPVARVAWRAARTTFDALARDLDAMRDAALGPLTAQCHRLANDVRRLQAGAAGSPRRRANAGTPAVEAGRQ